MRPGQWSSGSRFARRHRRQRRRRTGRLRALRVVHVGGARPGRFLRSGRIDLWAAAWKAYTAHPAFGLGGGGFEANSLQYLQNTPGVNIAASYVRAGRPVHDAYLEALVGLGPLGLAFFLAVLGITGFYLVRSSLRFRATGRVELQRVSPALMTSLVGLCVSMSFLSIGLGHAVWIFAGLALALDRISQRTTQAQEV